MKKILSVLCMVALSVTMLAGCADNDAADDGKLSIVTTIFPEYDWVRVITRGNDNIELTMLLDSGVDLHSFQPTADDIVKIGVCDVFIYVGGESDEWVEEVLEEVENNDMTVINLMDVLGGSVKEEEIKEGMEAEDEEEGEEEDGPEYDEHVWLSLKNADVICQYITEELCRIDPDNSELYKNNSQEYVTSLNALDKEYESAVNAASVKTVLFGDRFPFRYMVDDYGLNYYAAFAGCSAESEASFETVAFLSKKVDQLKLPAVLQLESADGKLADTIVKTAKAKGVQILTLDSMQSVTAKEAEAGTSYIEIMKNNLEVLKKAIN